jgi:3-hydroxyisobutyrate dehydrogenase
MAKIAFIGLGNMGGPMAANLVKGQHQVTAFDLAAAALDIAVEKGAKKAASAAEAVKGAEVVVTMLPAGKHVRGVYENDVLPNVAKGALLIDCSTIDVDSARHVGELAAKAGLEMVDAHTGPMGAGQAAKICNNMILGITMIGVAEGFLLGKRLGLDVQKLFNIVSTSSGSCWAVNNYLPLPGPVPTSPANRDYQAGFTADNMLKDLKLAQQAAQTSGASTPMGAEAAQLFNMFVNAGGGAKDFSGIIKMLEGK